MKNNEEYVTTTERNTSAVGEKRIFQTNKHFTTLWGCIYLSCPTANSDNSIKAIYFLAR